MLAVTPDSVAKRRAQCRVEGGGTPNPLYELEGRTAHRSSDPPDSPLELLAKATPCYDLEDDEPLEQVALTGDVKPSRTALEHHTAELETELLHMHSQCGQLKARLEASQALNNELQRALVDAHMPQEQGSRSRGAPALPGLPVIMEKDCEDAAAVSPPPASPFPIADVALHLANTTNQVLELQSRLDDKEVQLAAMGRQLQAAGLQPVDAQQLPLVVRASLADISNVGSRTPRHASPKKDSMQACQKDLAAERAECERMSGCMSALAADLQARDEHLSRMLGAMAASKPSAPHQGGAAQASAARAQMVGGLAAVATAAAGVLRELQQQAAHAAALQAIEGEASCEAWEQSESSSALARDSTGTEPAQQRQASSGDSSAVAAGGGGADAGTEAAAAAAPGPRQMECPRQGQRTSAGEVTALRLEFAALEQKLRERDASITQAHADARAAAAQARKAAIVQEARIAALQRQLDATAAGQPHVQPGAEEAHAAGEAAKQLVELQAALRAVQHARDEDRRQHTHAVAVLSKQLAAAEARCDELQRQLEAGGAAPGVGPSKASARIALLEADRNRKDLVLAREQLAKKNTKLETAAREAKSLQPALAAREQVLIALREELAGAHRAHSEAAHRLRAQRQKAAPWR